MLDAADLFFFIILFGIIAWPYCRLWFYIFHFVELYLLATAKATGSNLFHGPYLGDN